MHVVKDVLSVARVHADNRFAKSVDGLFSGAGIRPVAGFADALSAIIRSDADDKETVDQKSLDLFDFHGGGPSP